MVVLDGFSPESRQTVWPRGTAGRTDLRLPKKERHPQLYDFKEGHPEILRRKISRIDFEN